MSAPTRARISDGAVWIEMNSPGGEVSGLVDATTRPWTWTPGTYRPQSIFMPTPEQERLRLGIEAMLFRVAEAFMVDDFLCLDRAVKSSITELRPPEREVEPPPEWVTPSPWKRWKS